VEGPAHFRRDDYGHLLSVWEDAPFGIAFLNVAGEIVKSNAAMRSMTGYDESELAKLPVTAYTHPDDARESGSSFRGLIAGESSSYRLETRLVRKDGTTVWVDAFVTAAQATPDEPRTAVAMVHDVTSEREARREQVEALSRFETIFDCAPIGIGIVGLNGHLHHTNAVMREISGFSADELASRNVLDYTVPEDVDEVRELFTGLFTGKYDSYRHEHRLHGKDGAVVWVDTATALLRDADGKPKTAISMAQNITQRRAAEEQLRQSQKVEAIGQLSAGIAHDFNNLLLGILGYAELAQTEVDSTSPAADFLRHIEANGRRAATLTGQLLAFGRGQSLQPQPLALNALVSETVSMLGRVLGERIELVTALDPELDTVTADSSQMQQVLINLALNARDAMMPDGGPLTIRTRNVEVLDGELDSPELESGRYVVLSVEDTGHGMTQEVSDRMFDPFFTTKGVGEGTGLGLSSAYGIVKQSGGHMVAESEPARGSAFHCYLPALSTRPAAEEEPAREETLVLTAGAGKRILVVEDEDVVRTLIALTLERLGYAVETAADPSVALSTLRGRGDEFALVISDMMMPHMTGTEFAREVGRWKPELPFVFMSGYTDDVVAGADAATRGSFLQKPFNSETLAGTVRDALEHVA
jgi:two-component system, cell cycle sensor histidine kinase and response regulator CckA